MQWNNICILLQAVERVVNGGDKAENIYAKTYCLAPGAYRGSKGLG